MGPNNHHIDDYFGFTFDDYFTFTFTFVYSIVLDSDRSTFATS